MLSGHVSASWAMYLHLSDCSLYLSVGPGDRRWWCCSVGSMRVRGGGLDSNVREGAWCAPG